MARWVVTSRSQTNAIATLSPSKERPLPHSKHTNTFVFSQRLLSENAMLNLQSRLYSFRPRYYHLTIGPLGRNVKVGKFDLNFVPIQKTSPPNKLRTNTFFSRGDCYQTKKMRRRTCSLDSIRSDPDTTISLLARWVVTSRSEKFDLNFAPAQRTSPPNKLPTNTFFFRGDCYQKMRR